MLQLNLAQKLGSYIFPVRVWKGSSAENPVLELFYYRGEWQLGTEDALYSDGSRYRPLVVGLNELKDDLGKIRKVLVLGAGLGSAVSILDKMGHQPDITLVDIDEVVLRWVSELLPNQLLTSTKLVVGSAQTFIQETTQTWGLIIIDIFTGRIIPSFVSSEEFLENCKTHLHSDGFLIANYIVNDKAEWDIYFHTFSTVFPSVKLTEIGSNRVFVVKV